MGDHIQKIVTGGTESLLLAAKTAGLKGPAPVHLWNPPFCGDIDMQIRRDGTWFYLGTPIGRKPLVRLFSSILRLDETGYVLVTPVEKVGIRVDDVPFVAVDFEVENPGPDQRLTFVTNVDDIATAGPTNPLRFERDPKTGEPSPYILIRRNLEALIDRKSFYRMIEHCTKALVDDQEWFGLHSSGQFFPFVPASELPDL